MIILVWLAIFQNTTLDLKLLPINTDQKEAIAEVAEKNTSSVVKIRGYRQSLDGDIYDNFITRISEGTGFVIDSNGVILTNKHVVNSDGFIYRVITVDGITYDVKRILRDPNNDIAVIYIDPSQNQQNNLTTVNLGDSKEVDTGEQVAALGNDPGKIKPTLLTGVVLDTDDSIVTGRRRNRSLEVLDNLIQTDLDLVPGNSGSPLLDENGKVVGINTATSRMGDVSYAIPINEAKDFLETIE